MHLTRTEEPEEEPLTLDEAKLHCRVDISADDELITALITSARLWVEQHCINSLITQSYTVTYDYHDRSNGFWIVKRKFRLPQSPIQEIETITTYDSDNNATELDSDNYRLSGDYIVLNDNASWPTNLRLYDCLQIDFIAGFSDEANGIPKSIIQAMKMLVATWYENRESITDDVLASMNSNALEIPFGVKSLLAPYRTIEV